MADSKKLVWDVEGQRFYTTGVDRVALYLKSVSGSGYETGVAWSGVSAIEESPEGAESTAIYADNIKYLDLTSKEEFGCSITAYIILGTSAFVYCIMYNHGTRSLSGG